MGNNRNLTVVIKNINFTLFENWDLIRITVTIIEYDFEYVRVFKDLGVRSTSENYTRDEIQVRITQGNKCLFSLYVQNRSEKYFHIENNH